MMGHATISQTMDTYSHVMPDWGRLPPRRSKRHFRKNLLLPKAPGRVSGGFSCSAFCRNFTGALGRTRTCDLLIRLACQQIPLIQAEKAVLLCTYFLLRPALFYSYCCHTAAMDSRASAA